jgi:hypothetical protein
MFQINSSKKEKKTGVISHVLSGGQSVSYRSIRAGIAWPFRTAPAYYCIVAEREILNLKKKFPLIMLAEGESKNLESLFQKLSDLCTQLRCESIYTDLSSPETKCYEDLFWKFRHENMTASGLFLLQAPWIENFEFGLHLIRGRLDTRSLEILKDSIVAKQLGGMVETSLSVTTYREEEFYAVNALRFVLGSFEAYPTTSEDDVDESELHKPENLVGWKY